MTTATPTWVVLTGASRGLGSALAHGLLGQPNVHLLTIARQPDPALAAAAQAAGTPLQTLAADLATPAGITAAQAALQAIVAQAPVRLRVIHNAGTLGPTGVGVATDPQAVSAALTLNVTAPITLTEPLVAATLPPNADWRVMAISSGAGRRPFAGWGTYCASKAALDHYLRTAAEAAPSGLRLVSIAPGVIATDMQAAIRATPAATFPDHARFMALHEEGQLSQPAEVAAQLLHYLERDGFGQTLLDDIRNY